MIEVAIDQGREWSGDTDWRWHIIRAVDTAIRTSPYGSLAQIEPLVEVSVKLTNDAEVQQLNKSYRGKDKPTNVLSFPMVQPDLIEGLGNTDDGEILLGDIVVAFQTCADEAIDRGITIIDHVCHLVVHGTFHLLGYDHMDDVEADRMEALEKTALLYIGIADPYEDGMGKIDDNG